ncbi:hypothetical protein [Rhodohalobacter sulfatireducens]|uniref:Calx-beta domain-containing protein n=1 Tax=Rhodohalobacter sulfatireducens TaxID=2911366 RepID=A0ABS9KGX6_9BACT|nr:hypothetical protein [Rhodohalobacter sulfatireducens]MCG2590108.1 hypothetical protein [Rhodohalobacter sulfatireducens]
MKIIKIIFSVSVLTLLLLGCESVNEPISYEDGAVPAFVTIGTEGQDVVAGGSLEVVFELGQTQYENVTVEYTISGDAVEGDDYVFSSGTPGTVTIEHDPESTSLDNGSVTLDFPIQAALGTSRNLTFTLESATTESGETLSLGRGDIGLERTFVINGLGAVPTGTYTYEATGDFGPFSGTFEITQPDSPIVVGGAPYLFRTSNIAGALFGVDVAYAFNVTAGGDVLGAPNAHEEGFETIILDVSGNYNDTAGELTLDVTFQCCGVAGFGYQIVATPQP